MNDIPDDIEKIADNLAIMRLVEQNAELQARVKDAANWIMAARKEYPDLLPPRWVLEVADIFLPGDTL